MKYIRTENGIFEVDFVEYATYYHTTGWGIFEKEQIIAQANTIEELCDEFIDQEYHYIIKNKEIIREIPNNPTLKNHTIYGAIWTSKGLIYVAKMNDKGELELI